MAHSTDIVGYSYSGDNYSPSGILVALGEKVVGGENVESTLDRLAGYIGIDRYDESTYDSGLFPKVIFLDQVEGHTTFLHDDENIYLLGEL